MNFLDIRTIYFVVGFLNFLMPMITWVSMTSDRSRPTHLWCIGGLGFGFGGVLIAIRGAIPDWISFTVANIFILSSLLMRSHALRIELSLPRRHLTMVGLLIVYILVFEYIRLILENDLLRLQWGLLNLFMGSYYLAQLAWRISIQERSANARWIAIVYFLVSIGFLVRCIDMTFGNAPPDILINTSAGLKSMFMLLISSVVEHIGFIGMSLEKSIQQKIQLAATQARQQENRLLSEQIAQLDRPRSLGEMSASLGHELNQPLTAILTNAQVLR